MTDVPLVDDDSILDEDRLCRRINPSFIVDDEALGKRISSQAFQNSPGTDKMSVFVKKDLGDPSEVIPTGHGLAQFAAKVARSLAQIIVRDKSSEQHESHAHVVGAKSKTVRSRLAEAATSESWVIEPPNQATA